MRKIGKILALLVIASCGQAWAGSLTSEVDRVEGTLDDSFRVSVTIEGKHNKDLEFPPIEGMTIEQGGTSTNISTSFTFGSAEIHREEVHQFILTPKKEGHFTIPQLALEIDGKVEKTLPIQIRVKADAGSKGAKGDDGASLFFMERIVEPKTAYVGQAIVVATNLYNRVNAQNMSLANDVPPALRKIDTGKSQSKSSEVRNGQSYQVNSIWQVVTAMQPGTLDFPPYQAEALLDIPQRPDPRDPFGSFFGNPFGRRAIPKKAHSNSDKLTILPVPDSDKPAGFTGMVGQFSAAAHWDKTTVNTGDSVTLTVEVSGDGPLDVIDTLKMVPSASFKLYPDKPTLEQKILVDNAGARLSARKVFKWAVVPLQGGTQTLNFEEAYFFDPVQKKYQHLEWALPALQVSGKAIADSAGGSAPAHSEKLAAADIQNFRSSSGSSQSATMHTVEGLGWTVWCLASVLFWLATGPLRSWLRVRQERWMMPHWKKERRQLLQRLNAPVASDKDLSEILAQYRRVLALFFACNAESMTTSELREYLAQRAPSRSGEYLRPLQSYEEFLYRGQTNDGAWAAIAEQCREALAELKA